MGSEHLWERGKDRPLDAFVEFYENYPRKHYHTVATQTGPVAGVLNNIAGIIVNATIDTLTDRLGRLNQQTQQSINTQVEIIDQRRSGPACAGSAFYGTIPPCRDRPHTMPASAPARGCRTPTDVGGR